MSGRDVTEDELCHERLGAEAFERALSHYDTRRRVEVLVDDFLGPAALRGRDALDVGCGLGFFSARLVAHGARVVATDLGEGLVAETAARVGCEARVADALALTETFAPASFDVVVSSECIEHTPEPALAVRQMCRVLRPGGLLALSTPNLLWSPVVRGATALGLRPFDGHENFSTFGGLRRVLRDEGMIVRREVGLHLFPFQLRLHRLSRLCDRHLQALRPLMINLCVLAERPR